MNLDSTDVGLFSGITYDGGKGFLPLTNLDIQVSIIDTSGRVTFSQTYFYDDSSIPQNSFYLFPIPYDAIICGFEMRMNGGVHIEGIVRQLDEEQNLRDYRHILGDDDIIHIIEQSKHDMLVLSLGSFLPRTEITISVTYAIDLFDSKEPTIHFQFPSYIGRYMPRGTTSTMTQHDVSVGNNLPPAVLINLDIEMPGEILYVHSNLPLQNVPLSLSKDPRCIARKQFTTRNNSAFSDADFLINIQALGLDQSRCFVERFRSTAALSLNVVPYMEFSQQERDDCEYIFLIDRSWSMCMDDKMEQTKQAMKVLLKTLPIEGTWFNIYSFEHSYDSLWSKSQQFNQATLCEALNFILHLDPRGGTELFSVFQAVLVNRRTDITTKIFMLTDGEVHYPQWTIDLVTHAVQNANRTSPVKIFTVAIGSSASDVLCEGLAKAGNGFFSKTQDGESPMRKCTNVLNQMVLNDIHDMTVNWNVDGIVYQAPIDLSHHPTGCVSVKAMVPADNVPETVSILGKTSKGSPIHYEIPVRRAQGFVHPSFISSNQIANSWPAFHIIGAHNLSTDMERIGIPFITDWEKLTPSSQVSLIKRELLRLGMKFNIINSMATFVAVDSAEERHPTPISDRITLNDSDLPAGLPQLITRPSSPDSNENPGSSQSSDVLSLDDTESRPSTPISNASFPLMPGTFPDPPSSRKAFIVRTESVPDTRPDETYIFPSVPPTHFVAPPLKHEKIVISYSNPIRMFVRSLSMSQEKDARSMVADHITIWLDSAEYDAEFNEKFTDLIEMQWYDGSFPDLRRLSHLIACPYEDDISLYSKDIDVPFLTNFEALWATALAVKFLKKRYPQKWIVWKDLMRKSVAWGSRVCGDSSTFESIVDHLQLSL